MRWTRGARRTAAANCRIEMGRYNMKVDGNAAELYRAAVKLGFSVEVMHKPVDSIFGIFDQTAAVEVKQGDGKLEPKQIKFFATFKGLKVIVRSMGDVLELYRIMRRRYEALLGRGEWNGKETGKESGKKTGTRVAEKERARRRPQGARQQTARPTEPGAPRHEPRPQPKARQHLRGDRRRA